MRTLRIALMIAGVSVASALAQPPAAAVVNGEPVPLSLVQAELAKRPPTLTPLTPSQQKQMQREIVDSLIDEVLLRQFLAKNAPPVTAADLARELATLTTAQKAVGKTLDDYYRESGQTAEQVKANITQILQLDHWAKGRCTPEALRKYYDENKDFFDLVKVRARHIVLTLEPGAPAADKQKAREKLTALRQEIAAGKLDFAKAAEQHSQCPSSTKGGDLGFFLRKRMMDESFAKAAFALKPKSLSEVVESEYGLHLIYVEERQPGTPSTFEGAQAEVRDCYTEELRQNLIGDLRKQAKIEMKLP